MSEYGKCPQCGVEIDSSTTVAATALCVACVKRNRKNMDRARELRARIKEPDPSGDFWSDLVKRVYKSPGGLASLTHAERVYFLVSCVDGEVYNGGLHQFFNNSAGNNYDETVIALREIGAARDAELLAEAAHLLFPDSPPPRDWDARRARLPCWPDDPNASMPAWCDRLAELDSEFTADSKAISQLLTSHARSNNLFGIAGATTQTEGEQSLAS